MSVYKRGKTWWIDYRVHGKRVREAIGDKDEARVALGERIKDVRQGRNPELRRIKPILFEDMVKVYLERHAKAMKSYSSFLTSTNILELHFKGRTLQDIRSRDIEDFKVARKAEGVENGTLNRNLSILSGLYTCASKWEMFGGISPVKHVEKPRESPGRIRWLTADEAEALLSKAKGHLRLAMLIALHTGGRLSEVLRLKWDAINLEAGTIHYDKTTTKSSKGRDIPIDATLAAALREAGKVVRFDGDRHVLTWGKKPIWRISTAFTKARTDAGLGEDVTFHVLRHTFASWFMMNGGDIYRLKGYMGHSDIRLTERYAHLHPTYQQEGVRYFGPPAAGHKMDTKGVGAGSAGSASA